MKNTSQIFSPNVWIICSFSIVILPLSLYTIGVVFEGERMVTYEFLIIFFLIAEQSILLKPSSLPETTIKVLIIQVVF